MCLGKSPFFGICQCVGGRLSKTPLEEFSEYFMDLAFLSPHDLWPLTLPCLATKKQGNWSQKNISILTRDLPLDFMYVNLIKKGFILRQIDLDDKLINLNQKRFLMKIAPATTPIITEAANAGMA